MNSNQKNYYILVTGLMSSGKSTIMREYALNFEIKDFTEPPVKVQFNGLNFQFIDATFAIEKDNVLYNFYELDAPTIRKWYQFIEAADAVVIVFNQNPKVLYGTHPELRDSILKSIKKEKPIFIIANNASNIVEGEKRVNEVYQLNQYPDYNFHVLFMPKGQSVFDEQYGRRILLDQNHLKSVFNEVISQINKSGQ